jgi:hypothetical protein
MSHTRIDDDMKGMMMMHRLILDLSRSSHVFLRIVTRLTGENEIGDL